VDEHDYDDDDDFMSDGGLSWLVLLVVGTLFIDILRDTRGTSQSNLKFNVDVDAEFATIPGLLGLPVNTAPVGVQSLAPIARPALKIWGLYLLRRRRKAGNREGLSPAFHS
jgi:hypothetical protein